MRTSEAGKLFIKQFESFRAMMYHDERGFPTIGWGHKIDVGQEKWLLSAVITLAQAEELFDQDIYFKAEMCLNHYVKIPLNQYEVDALSSLIFNIGCGNFVTSTLLKKMYNAAYTMQDIAEEFPRWDKEEIDGKLVESPGLLRRRQAEKQMFLGRKVDIV